MGEEPREPDEYLPLTPAVLDIVVVALGDGELHGYGIMREVRQMQWGALTPTSMTSGAATTDSRIWAKGSLSRRSNDSRVWCAQRVRRTSPRAGFPLGLLEAPDGLA
jgi:hypothetical protein